MLPSLPWTVLFSFESCTSSFVWTSNVFSSLPRLGSENGEYWSWLSLISAKNRVHTLSLHSVTSQERKVRTLPVVKKWQVHHVKTSVAKRGHVQNNALQEMVSCGGIWKSWDSYTIAEVRGHMLFCDYRGQMWILDFYSTAGCGQCSPPSWFL